MRKDEFETIYRKIIQSADGFFQLSRTNPHVRAYYLPFMDGQLQTLRFLTDFVESDSDYEKERLDSEILALFGPFPQRTYVRYMKAVQAKTPQQKKVLEAMDIIGNILEGREPLPRRRRGRRSTS